MVVYGLRAWRLLRTLPGLKREDITAYTLLGPYLLWTAVLWLFPFFWVIWLALQRWNFISPPAFVGLENFKTVLTDRLFWNTFKNQLYFLAVFVPVVTVTSLTLALLLNRLKFLQEIFATGYLLSYMSATVAMSLVFVLLFSADGLINTWLEKLIGTRIYFFGDPKIAMASIAMVVVWKFTGYYALIFLAGLQAIPQDIYEAAEIDGAGRWTKLWRITIPLLNPALVTVVVFATMLSFNIFAEPFIITAGGPEHSTETFALNIFTKLFESLDAGYASALAILSTLITFMFIFIVRKLVEREVGL